MKETADDGFLVQFQICQDQGNAKGVNDVGLTGLAQLSLVGIVGDMVSFFDHAEVIRRMIFLQFIDQLTIQLFRLLEVLGLYEFALSDRLNGIIIHLFMIILRHK